VMVAVAVAVKMKNGKCKNETGEDGRERIM
jgi:hypothetical protein